MEVRASLIIIGNEILSGRTQDINLSYVAKKLGEAGIRLAEARVVADDEVEIVEAVNTLRTKYDYVFTTGGIGPTHDDITAACVAKAFDLPLTQHPEALRILSHHYEAMNLEMNEARARMTMTPEGAGLIDNPVSAAPGFYVENVYVMAGVPKIMQVMLDGVVPNLKSGDVVLSKTILCSLPEGEIAAALGQVQADYTALDVGSYPAFLRDSFRVSLVVRGIDPEALDKCALDITRHIEDLGGQFELA